MLILWNKDVIAWSKAVAVFRRKNIVALRSRRVMVVEETTEIVCAICVHAVQCTKWMVQNLDGIKFDKFIDHLI